MILYQAKDSIQDYKYRAETWLSKHIRYYAAFEPDQAKVHSTLLWLFDMGNWLE